MNFEQEMQRRVHDIEDIIKQFLPPKEGPQKLIMETMDYALLIGGKRIRPLLMSETYRMFGGAEKVIEPFIAAIEMIHTYSLVHDDLPAMDNDDYRRGQKTIHVVYGEDLAILTGDALLNYAFEVMTKALKGYPKQSLQIGEAIGEVAEKAGIYGMIGGQVVDVTAAGKTISLEQLDYIYTRKTCALLEASMKVGAILAGAPEEKVQVMEEIARSVGLAFQIQDDILDVSGSFEVLGKPIHSDDKNDKTTFVTLKGLTKAKAEVARLSTEALALLDSLEEQNIFLKETIKALVVREK